MKTSKYVSYVFGIAVLFSFLFTISPPPATAADALRVAILPFDIHADKNLDFLKTGIQDMLSSRLSWENRVVVLEKSEVNHAVAQLMPHAGDSLALLVGGRLKADYIITGSLTVIGQGASIDAKLMDITGTAPLPFSGQTATLGGVIPEINRFATAINQQVFHRQTKSISTETLRTAPPGNAPASPRDKKSAPNPMFQPAAPSSAPGLTMNPNFQTLTQAGSYTGFWKSRLLPFRITGMDVGDVNNDGVLETVVLTDKAIILYHIKANRLVKVSEIPFSSLSHPLGIDIGDINNNGIPEIFVTSLAPERDRANSYVLEFNGREYVTISKPAAWYYRVSKAPSGRTVLLGQKQRTRDRNIFSAPVHELTWQRNAYLPSGTILKAHTANALGCSAAISMGQGSPVVAAFDTMEHLTLFSGTNMQMWRNPEPGGGSLSSFCATQGTCG